MVEGLEFWTKFEVYGLSLKLNLKLDIGILNVEVGEFECWSWILEIWMLKLDIGNCEILGFILEFWIGECWILYNWMLHLVIGMFNVKVGGWNV